MEWVRPVGHVTIHAEVVEDTPPIRWRACQREDSHGSNTNTIAYGGHGEQNSARYDSFFFGFLGLAFALLAFFT
jgi:hypothetical protein